MKTKRLYGAVDIAKYISALLVIAIHTFPFAGISETFNLYFISTICRMAVPFFFTISAYFFFTKLRYDDGRFLSRGSVFWKYLKRLGILYLVWTVIYLPYTIWNWASGGFSISFILGWIRDFFLNGSYYHLWFLPALILGMIIVYRLLTQKSLKEALIVSLVLYGIGYLLNIYGPIWEGLPFINILYGFLMKILGTARDGIFFAPIFLVLGALLSKTGRMSWKASLVGLIISFLLLCLEAWLYHKIGCLTDLSSMFLSLIPCEFFLCNMVLSLRIPYKPVYREMREDSTLYYTSHILFTRVLFILLGDANLVVYLATLALCQCFSYVVLHFSERYPWLHYLY